MTAPQTPGTKIWAPACDQQKPRCGPPSLVPGRSPGCEAFRESARSDWDRGGGDLEQRAGSGGAGGYSPGSRRRWQAAEQGRERRASRVISTGPGAGLGTWDTWGHARERPRPQAGPPPGASKNLRPLAGGRVPASSSCLPSPFPPRRPPSAPGPAPAQPPGGARAWARAARVSGRVCELVAPTKAAVAGTCVTGRVIAAFLLETRRLALGERSECLEARAGIKVA